jgi:hypothetical protein
MTDPSLFQLKVPLGQVTSNWLKSALLGSLIWPLTLIFTETIEWNFSVVQIYIWIVGFSICFSIFYSLPALILFLLSGYLLNRNKPSFRTYIIWHNSIHTIAAISTFSLLDFENMAEIEFPSKMLIAIAYTLCGLFIWNTMYYKLSKTTKPAQQ